MQNKRRNKLEIIEEILKFTKVEPRKKSHIVYKANSNFNVIKKYLNEMLESGLLILKDNPGGYTITNRGEKYLEEYSELKEGWGEFRQRYQI